MNAYIIKAIVLKVWSKTPKAIELHLVGLRNSSFPIYISVPDQIFSLYFK